MRHLGKLSLLALCWPTLAFAQSPTNKATAVQLFDEADKLMASGNVSSACPKYAASMKLDPQLGALLHLADCYAKNGQLASAWASFREAQEMATLRNDDRASLAQQRAKEIEPRLSRVTVLVPSSSNLAGLEVRVDGAPITSGAWGVASPIDPGSHGVEARAPGYETWSSSIDVTGETQSVRVEIPILTPSRAATPATGPMGPATNGDNSGDSGAVIRGLGWAGIGAGVVGISLGAVFLVQKNHKLDDRSKVCPDGDFNKCNTTEQQQRINTFTDDANSAGTLSNVGFVAGGVLLAGGITALVLAPRSKPKSGATWVLPTLSANMVGVMGEATW